MSNAMKLLLQKCSKPTILAAPMNGGINNPAFAAAVISSGGIGGFGFTYHSPQQITNDIEETRKRATGPINANFFVFDNVDTPADVDISKATDALVSNLSKITISDIKIPTAPYNPNLELQMHAIWSARPELLTFHFDIPQREFILEAQALGIAVGVTATCPEEALLIQESGADFIVAQGFEAGGHRGIFNSAWRSFKDPASAAAGSFVDTHCFFYTTPTQISFFYAEDSQLSTLELVRLLVSNAVGVSIPIVAAGGIMNGQDISAAIKAGASAVQMGTAFLPCRESTASNDHKRAILQAEDPTTVITKSFSGRPARGIRNEFINRMDSSFVLDFPLQNTLTSSIRSKAVREKDLGHQSLWAGSAYARARERWDGRAGSSKVDGGMVDYLSVTELMQQLQQEYQQEEAALHKL